MSHAFEKLLGLRVEAKGILNMILRKGPLTKSEIQDLANVKLSTLNRIMHPLERDRFIVEAAIGESTGGRKPVLFAVNNRHYYLVGVDISRTYTQMVIVNLRTEILHYKRFIMDESTTPRLVVNLISEFVNEAIEKLKINKDEIIGIGIGTVGPLDIINGKILNPRKFLNKEWKDITIREMVEAETGLAVTVDNGANTAALVEYMHGAGKGYNSLAYINCGVGIRTGVISSGMIVRTINNAEDAFGHMVIDVDGELCCCGNYGCIECYSSIPSIVRKFTSELKKGRINTADKNLGDINYIDICKLAENGDQLAQEVIISSASVLGVGLANYINLLNPEVVILSGPLIKNSKLYFDTCTSIALKKCYLREESCIQFSRGGFFKDNAMAVGAAVSMIEKVLSA